jgi:hypothetical protein
LAEASSNQKRQKRHVNLKKKNIQRKGKRTIATVTSKTKINTCYHKIKMYFDFIPVGAEGPFPSPATPKKPFKKVIKALHVLISFSNA